MGHHDGVIVEEHDVASPCLLKGDIAEVVPVNAGIANHAHRYREANARGKELSVWPSSHDDLADRQPLHANTEEIRDRASLGSNDPRRGYQDGDRNRST